MPAVARRHASASASSPQRARGAGAAISPGEAGQRRGQTSASPGLGPGPGDGRQAPPPAATRALTMHFRLGTSMANAASAWCWRGRTPQRTLPVIASEDSSATTIGTMIHRGQRLCLFLAGGAAYNDCATVAGTTNAAKAAEFDRRTIRPGFWKSAGATDVVDGGSLPIAGRARTL